MVKRPLREIVVYGYLMEYSEIMTAIAIVQKNHSALRQKARKVPAANIASPRIHRLIKNLSEILAKEEDGVAIAACQIAEPVAIFVVSGKALDMLDKGPDKTPHKDIAFINPEIVKRSRDKQWLDEGCLSVRWLYGQVKRSEKIRLRAKDPAGKTFEMGASGLLAQIFQHEMEHLEGILFTDKARNVTEIPPEKGKGQKLKI